ncbi:MAG: GIY-YIG nuclease family protein [Methylophilus sp.]|jgi:putative endonuclease
MDNNTQSVQATAQDKWVLYLLACKNGHFYAGISNDLNARFAAHLAGKGAKYTRANPPVAILASQNYPDRSQASIAEAQLKKLPRAKKLAFFEKQVQTSSHLETA